MFTCEKCNLVWNDYRQSELHTEKRRLCVYCEEGSTIHLKTKEVKVLKYIKDSFPAIQLTYNKNVGTACTPNRKYPDIMIDRGTHCIVIEIDEFQHSGYDSRCENVRMHDISAELGLPCVFIRFNPDTYRIKNVIRKIPDKSRLDLLKKQVQHHIDTIPTEWLTVEQLFYNCQCDDECGHMHSTTLTLDQLKTYL
jgi:hypothetical protein